MVSLLQFDIFVLLAIAVVILFSGLIHGTLGLGFPMVATPMLATMMDVRSAILITLLPTMAVNIASIFNNQSSLAGTKNFFPLIGFSLLGAIVGSGMLAVTDPAAYRIVLAALILLYLGSHLRISRTWLDQYPTLSMAAFGLTAGISAGTTNVMVAVLIIYFLSLQTPRSVMVPALNSCFLVGKIAQIIVLALAGLVTIGLMIETTPLAAIAIVALMVGQRLQSRIDVQTYQNLLRKILMLLAAILIYQFINETILS